jgi:hypothetical protein
VDPDLHLAEGSDPDPYKSVTLDGSCVIEILHTWCGTGTILSPDPQKHCMRNAQVMVEKNVPNKLTKWGVA